ncbi:MAG: endonuclease/exonuclease/phosphatase family protein [Mangrovibacterium sp.]
MRSSFITLIVVILTVGLAHAQQPYSFLFYNVENLMDTQNDSIKNDDEFTPTGLRAWTEYKLQQKIDHIAKVILAANGFNYPDAIGLCEVENYQLIERLINTTPLQKIGYRYIHKESPDGRGIDTALLYRPNRIKPQWYKYHPLINPSGDTIATREILECKFTAASDSFHIFINHWPSRYGGELKSAPKRMLAAQTLWQIIEKNNSTAGATNNIILGDFNDEPADNSLAWLCQRSHQLTNLSADWDSKLGTLKFQSNWSIFDQIIISKNLKDKYPIGKIVSLHFLFKEDEKWEGQKLFRTFHGYQYEGGFSDHLPIILLLNL